MNSPPLSVRIVETVSEMTEADPTELPSLYETVDPEALETLVNSMAHGVVSFEYAGYSLTVESNGSVQLKQPV